MAAWTSFGGLSVCRFLVGDFEALLIPAVTLVVATWYRPEERPTCNSIVLNAIASIPSGFIAWLVGYHKGSFAPWKIKLLTLGH